MIRTLLLASALAGAIASTALAADLPHKRAYQPAVYEATPIARWSGFELGAYGAMSSSNTWNSSDLFGIVSLDSTASATGIGGGVTAAYYWQIGKFVVGPQIEWGFSGAKTSWTDSFGFGHSMTDQAHFAVLANIGYDFGQFKPYVLGGLSFGSQKYCPSIGGIDDCWTAHTTAPMVGLGLAMALTPDLHAYVQWDSAFYRSRSHDNLLFTGIIDTNKTTVSEVRGGITYRFF